MRIVVFSDSHNDNYFALKNIVRKQPGADVFLHLGDGEMDVEELMAICPQKRILYVAGNCDWGSRAPLQQTVMCKGKKVFFTHGHSFHVKRDLVELKHYARDIGADIALFGHTHVAEKLYEDGLYIMNPGSVSFPRDGKPSYGFIDITDAGIAMNIVRL